MMMTTDIPGFQEENFIVKCCERCGKIFRTRSNEKEICSKCVSYLNALAAKRAMRQKSCKTSSSEPGKGERLTIAQISRLAAEKGMSYGEYVEKFGTSR